MIRFLARIWKSLHLPKGMQLNFMRLLQDQFLVGVTGVIFNEKNEVLLFKHTYRNQDWGLPGGYVKAKEHPKEGLEREILEESGITVSADIRYKIRSDRDTARLDIVYIGSYIGGEFHASSEVSEGKFFRFEEIPQIMKTDVLLLSKIYAQRKRGKFIRPE